MRRKFHVSLAALIVFLSGMLLLNVFNGTTQAAAPRDCDSNSIINCGALTHSELTQKYGQNQSGDLEAIYDHYGVSASMITAGASMGEVHKDGRITVSGETVATDATSIGRQNIFSGSTTVNIGGRTYYDTPNSRAFRSETISAFVFLDKDGKFIAAILTSCGNPVSGKPVPPKPKPVYACNSLTADKISRDTYNFKADATASGGVTIVGYRYDFGDGKTENKPVATVSHAYSQPGEYVAKLVADVKVAGQVKQVTAPACQVKVSVKPQAAFACESLSARVIKKEDRSYAFDLKYTATEGASLQTADFDFGDGQGREGVKPSELTSVAHNYPQNGTFTTKATLHFLTGDDKNSLQDDDCQVTVTVSPETVTPPPSVPELPQTGPIDIIGASLGIGSLVATGYYWYASRRGLLDAWLSR